MKTTINRNESTQELVLHRCERPLYFALGILLLIQFLLISLPVRADNCVTLTWDAVTLNEDNSTCDDLAKYRLYLGESSGNYTETHDTTAVTYQVCNLLAGHTYFFAVTAIDTSNNQSAFSNEVSSFISPSELAQSRPPVLDFDGSGYSSIVTVQNVKTGPKRQLKFKISALDGSTSREEVFGSKGDLPAVGDYDGDSIADLAVVHRAKSAYQWISKNSSDGQISTVKFGKAGDMILAGCQFDTHAALDQALIKGKNRLVVRKSSDGKTRTARVKKFPASVKSLSCADLNGDGVDELLVLGKGGPAVRSAGYRSRAADNKWTIMGFNAVSGAQVYTRVTVKPLKLLAADYDDNGILDPAYTRKLRNGLRANFFVGSSQNSSAVDLEPLTGIVEIKLDQAAQGKVDGLLYSAKSGSAIKILNLQTKLAASSGLTLAAGERLVGPFSWKH